MDTLANYSNTSDTLEVYQRYVDQTGEPMAASILVLADVVGMACENVTENAELAIRYGIRGAFFLGDCQGVHDITAQVLQALDNRHDAGEQT